MLKDNVKKLLSAIANGNERGEKITLVAATKTVPVQTINEAISYGIPVVAENKVQEFREKTDKIIGASQHFIGSLQTNKVKYLVGKVALIQSVDSLRLAEEISRVAQKRGVVQDVLAEVNIGGEPTKSGVSPDSAKEFVKNIAALDGICVKGLMAMLPVSDDEAYLAELCRKMRKTYDELKSDGYPFCYLSLGMSADYPIAIKNGSNMIRVGSGIFGKRNYGAINGTSSAAELKNVPSEKETSGAVGLKTGSTKTKQD